MFLSVALDKAAGYHGALVPVEPYEIHNENADMGG